MMLTTRIALRSQEEADKPLDAQINVQLRQPVLRPLLILGFIPSLPESPSRDSAGVSRVGDSGHFCDPKLKVDKTLDNLARVHELAGDFAEAESMYQEALRITEDLLGKHHPDYAIGLGKLASLYQSRDDFSE
jgi:hypothetical protein